MLKRSALATFGQINSHETVKDNLVSTVWGTSVLRSAICESSGHFCVRSVSREDFGHKRFRNRLISNSYKSNKFLASLDIKKLMRLP